ncbi:ergothioneine biosynthesis protein EgtB [Polymorphobacter glacialis]|uniref:Ergothioneine biosynthesis protein EgtB n=1 Tax=Sandarakinorhabdus glacialis TaxID=1614636 RepID=A0A916ZSK0_9SPHN|nr:ergothioneine biosynthesis protein EgtB [Polymorphobacter glacialis]GGE09318.1 ergothioneine biosynthesis protein EgtB [Polymorphobacter glacialis]
MASVSLAPAATLRVDFAATRALSVSLVAPLSDADASAQSMPDASPVKWHLAHTTWFLETFVLAEMPGYRVFDDRFGYLFNSYYESVGARHSRVARGLITRPSLEDVLAYRYHVDGALDRHWHALGAEHLALITLGVNHEQQHQELLLTDILDLFAANPIEPAMFPPTRLESVAVGNGWTRHDGGIVRVGHDGDGFAFDCEGPAHEVLVRPFALADRLVTNADWAAFIADDGYRKAALWLSDGWAWVNREAIAAPLRWQHGNDGWTSFTLSGRRSVDPAAPVTHISFYEADAFASWAGARLPTEAEWEVAAQAHDAGSGNQLDRAGPVAPTGTASLFGDCWQWTASAFLPYPGFRPVGGAVGEYNGKFMNGQMVLKGASCATPRGSSRASVRNFFYPAQRWQFTGLRLAREL